MKKCPTCKHEISRSTTSCPSCGKRFTSTLTKIIAGLFVVVFIVSVFGEEDPRRRGSNAVPDLEVDAIAECQDRYKESSIFDADICLGCYATEERNDHWYVWLEGKMKNGFGAWEKIDAACWFDKESKSIIKFNLLRNDK